LDQHNSGIEIEVHTALQSSIQQQKPDWWVRSKVTCVANNGEYRPDVGGWCHRPSRGQRTKPIVHSCPPPNLWIEVIYLFFFFSKIYLSLIIVYEYFRLFIIIKKNVKKR